MKDKERKSSKRNSKLSRENMRGRSLAARCTAWLLVLAMGVASGCAPNSTIPGNEPEKPGQTVVSGTNESKEGETKTDVSGQGGNGSSEKPGGTAVMAGVKDLMAEQDHRSSRYCS